MKTSSGLWWRTLEAIISASKAIHSINAIHITKTICQAMKCQGMLGRINPFKTWIWVVLSDYLYYWVCVDTLHSLYIGAHFPCCWEILQWLLIRENEINIEDEGKYVWTFVDFSTWRRKKIELNLFYIYCCGQRQKRITI